MRATHLNTAVFAFGRFNPPTIGHGRLVEVVKKQPGIPFLFLTHTQKPKTDPLTFIQKVKYAKASFTNIKIGNSSVKTLIQALQKLESLGFLNIIMVCGEDRLEQFSSFLPKYNGKDYSFETVKVVSAGERDPDSEGAIGMSASKMKDMAQSGDFEGFKKGTINPEIAKEMYDDVRTGLGITVQEYVTPEKKAERDALMKKYFAKGGKIQKVPTGQTAYKGKELKPAFKKDPGTPVTSPMSDESIKEAKYQMPKVYVDIDGVLADFFTALAKFRGVDHWKDGGQGDVQDSITAIQGTDFFSTLPVFDSASQVVSSVKEFTGGEWYINSSPLRGDHENSTKHKLKWLKTHNFNPTDIIITGRKESYAVDKQTNQPNILIDDKPANLARWTNKGGIGLRYQATQDNVSKVKKGLEVINSYLQKNNGLINPKDVSKLNQDVETGTILEENGARVVKGINTTVDVGPNEIKIQAAKMGFNVTKDGVPPLLKPKNLREYIEAVEEKGGKELKFQNRDGKYSMLTLPGTKKWQKMKKNSKPGTEDWFKTWKTMSYLTKGRKNHYMLPIKEELENLLLRYGVIKKD
jgi:5'(3')-deoxyribonucleotidase/nicotinic acid mononucleotide adenylyltransferase